MKVAEGVNLARYLRKYGRKVVVSITPPIITTCIRKVRDRLLWCHTRPFPLPDPSEYSTLENPLEVPVQVESYLFCRDKYLKSTDVVLDVGFGLGYGMHIMSAKARRILGAEVDGRAVVRAKRIFAGHERMGDILLYDGIHLPWQDKSVDFVTCVEVLEHVEDYQELLREMARVARRGIFITTPNRRRENTCRDGRPKNYWHLREWTQPEVDVILKGLGLSCEWNFLNGPFKGPFNWTDTLAENTSSLVPVIKLAQERR